jgi:tetratricopeptide (TPR) repeat protein
VSISSGVSLLKCSVVLFALATTLPNSWSPAWCTTNTNIAPALTQYEVVTPLFADVLNSVLRDHQSGRLPEARQRLYRFLTRVPNHPVATAALVDLYLREVELYKLTRLTMPTHDRAEKTRIQGLLMAAIKPYGDHPRLQAAYQRWQLAFNPVAPGQNLHWQASYQPTQLGAYLSWAKRLMAEKNWSDAKQVALVALELSPTHPDSYLVMSELLLATDHPKDAERFAGQAEALQADKRVKDGAVRLAAIRQSLDAAMLDVTPIPSVGLSGPDQASYGQAGITNRPAYSLLTPLFTKKYACTMAELHQRLPLAQTADEQLALWEGISALAVHYKRSHTTALLNPALLRQYQQELSEPWRQQNLPLPESAQLSLERLLWAGTDAMTASSPTLTLLSQSRNDAIAGQALFMLGQYAKANERLDALDGASPEGYQAIADILLLHHAFTMADAMAQRGLQMGALPTLGGSTIALDQQRELARKAVRFGDVDAQRKDWLSARKQFEQASQIWPEWEAPYLRMGELSIKRKQHGDAYKQYQQAVNISPGLLSSPAFAKRYAKLAKKAGVMVASPTIAPKTKH